MTYNLDALHAVRDRKPAPKDTWRPPVPEDLSGDIVIAFDQTLSATAAMCVHLDPHGQLVVNGPQMFAGSAPSSLGGTEADLSGTEADLCKGVSIYHQFVTYLGKMRAMHRGDPITVVHEAPPVGGGVIRRPESSLLAAQALRIAADHLEIPVAPMVTSQAHKKAICGDAKADKRDAHTALAQLAADWPIRDYERYVTNADKRDALCVGITHLLRKD